MGEDIKEIHLVARDTKIGVEALRSDSHLDKVKKWLSPPDTSTNFNEAKKVRHPGTGTWFLESQSFIEWKSGTRRHLWLHGLAGCGKTVLASAILDDLNSVQPDSCVTLDFFFAFSDKDKQQLDNLLRSLAFQLYAQCIDSRKELDSLFASHEDGRKQPLTDSLSSCVHLMMRLAKKVQIVLDALDECVTTRELLQWLKTLSHGEFANIRLVATSRREEELESALSMWIPDKDCVAIHRNAVDADIHSYVHARLQAAGGEYQRRWASMPSVLEEIESVAGGKADGMFRWAACQLDILERCLDYDELQRALNSLPSTLDETYSRILTSIPEGRREKAIRLLQFLAYSERPLTIQEAVDAVAIRLGSGSDFDPKYRLPCPEEITRFCPSLVSLVTREEGTKTIRELQLAHFSVKEYLTSRKLAEPFQDKFSEANARGYITRVCLAYLSCLDYEGWMYAPIDAKFPLAQYSAQYWMDHARLAQTLDDVQVSILTFFKCDTTYAIWGHLFNPEKPWDNRNWPIRKPASPLYYASLKGLAVTVRKLLNKGADISAQGGEYGNALQAASYAGHDSIVKMLLDEGANANVQGGLYSNALQAASYVGHDSIVKMLLDEGANVNAQGGEYDNALNAASLEGHESIVKMLLGNGANVKAQGGRCGNALQAASYAGHDSIVRTLLDVGANVNAQGGYNGNALQAASYAGHDSIVRTLLDGGANVNAQGGDGSALVAASNEGHGSIVKMLLDEGANVNAQGGYNGNALQAASYAGHDSIVRTLLDGGANVNAQGGYYGNALRAASYRGHDSIVRTLLDEGANVNAQGGEYDNALNAASYGGHDSIVKMLLDVGANVNAQGDEYGNALEAASNGGRYRAGGHRSIVKMLLDEGACEGTVT